MKYKILITGGAGYVGAVLVPKLLMEGHTISVVDLFMYGDNVLPNHERLKKHKLDIRNISEINNIIKGHDMVIHLACISNDPSFELNPNLGKSINLDAFRPLVECSISNEVKRFIYASSSSVYGIKNEKNVHEDMSLEPLTDYSKFKAKCEEILNEYKSEDFTTVTIRPATVCGYSPRQRLDVVLNIFANNAYHNREISVFGGSQLRPNINIKDMVRAYQALIHADKEIINGEIYNAGDMNYSVLELAEITKDVMGEDIKLTITESDDNRSYHISSDKILKVLGFKTENTLKDAVEDVKKAFEDNRLEDPLNNEYYYNIKMMQKNNLK
jgi:nucleoside-diphosphate-sugar epimerase